MSKRIQKLTALSVQSIRKPGRYSDCEGLYLQVTKAGKLLLEGLDPIEQKLKKQKSLIVQEAKEATFMECSKRYMENQRSSWKNKKHAQQWENTLATYAFPVIGDLQVSEVDTNLVCKILDPIWRTKTETASRLRNRIELVLDWATVREFRQGENPARWRGHLDKVFPPPAKIKTVKHHRAMDFCDVSGFVCKLNKRGDAGSRALECLILTACRTNEVLGMEWNEVDLDLGVWSIPSWRMKSGKAHRVPLSNRVKALLEEQRGLRANELVWPGRSKNKPMSNMTLTMVLRRMGCPYTSHGFRSTFRDWVSERTNYSSEVAEMALSHTIKNRAEAAYRRGDLLLKRAQLMEDWAKYCYTPKQPSELLAIRGAR
jgi:integrase